MLPHGRLLTLSDPLEQVGRADGPLLVWPWEKKVVAEPEAEEEPEPPSPPLPLLPLPPPPTRASAGFRADPNRLGSPAFPLRPVHVGTFTCSCRRRSNDSRNEAAAFCATRCASVAAVLLTGFLVASPTTAS